ncbi:unnamed protein product, partial [Brenthis ino]
MRVCLCRHQARSILFACAKDARVCGDCLYTEARVGAALVGDSGDNLRIDVRAHIESPNGILYDDADGADQLTRRHKSSLEHLHLPKNANFRPIILLIYGSKKTFVNF